MVEGSTVPEVPPGYGRPLGSGSGADPSAIVDNGALDKGPESFGGTGAAAREQRAAALDVWLADLLARASTGTDVALVALGGLGRRECAPLADLDLVLLHAEPDARSASSRAGAAEDDMA